jgi:hypothetical protein
MKFRFTACLFAGLAFAAAANAEDPSGRFGARTRDEFRAALANRPHDPAGARADKMLAGAQQVTRCMRHTEVRKLMGDPAFGNATHRSGESSGKSAGAAWTYVLSTVRDVNDQYDRMITVWLDENGRVRSLHPRGVDDVLPLRDNKQKCA